MGWSAEECGRETEWVGRDIKASKKQWSVAGCQLSVRQPAAKSCRVRAGEVRPR